MIINLLSFILIFPFLFINAQSDSAKTFELNQITVTATKFEQLLRIFTNSYSAFSEKEIKQDIKPALLSSISGRTPGLFVTESGIKGFGIGSNASGKISIRGINGMQQTLIVVDGRPEFAGIFGHPISDVYQSSEISAVEVVRGPASVLYGTNAMGGLIYITTNKHQPEGFNISTDLNYGSFDTYKIKGSISFKKGSFKNYFSITSDYSNDNRPSSSSKSISGIYNAEFIFNTSWSLSFNTYLNSSKVFNPGPISNPYLNNSVWTNVTRVNSSLNLRNKFGKYEGSLLVFFNNGVHDIYDGFHSNDNILGLIFNESFELFDNNVTSLGVEVKRYTGKARFNFPIIDKSVSEKAVYLLFSQKIMNSYVVNGGLRLNHHSVYGSLFIPQFSLSYNSSNNFSVYASISEGFRSPTLNELFLFGANINLKPERLWSYEVGFKTEPLKSTLFLNGSLYLIEGKDFINMVGIYPNIQNQNIKSITNRGFELESKFNVAKNLSLSANYSYLKSSEKLIGVPQQQLFFEASYSYKIFTFNVNFKNISNLYTTLKPNEKKQSYFLLNASLWIDVFNQINLYMKLDNVLNRRYEIINEYPMPGRTILVGTAINTNF
ncbi:MAG: TonB-dependent receptor [Melioribacter sp.]|nr:TonB-dependent receptor [Melioribacter sp.]